jgi:predicted RNA-binding Zn-ribbon protein involved in translation (DUF1610 family)
MHRLRLRALAVVLGLVLGALAVVGWMSVPVLPALGVALVTAAALVHTMSSRLSLPTCAGCGKDLTGNSPGAYGVICPDCGTINQHIGEPRRA